MLKSLGRDLGQFDVQHRLATGDFIDHQLTGNRPKTEAEHGVAGGDGHVSEAGDGADAGETIGSAGAQARPRLDAGEIVRGEGGEELAEAFDDALKALGVYGQIGAANFHSATDAEFVTHGGDGDAGFLEQ